MTTVIDRIKKLMALSENNPNDNEAAVAMERASELMLQHNIKKTDLEDTPVIINGKIRGGLKPWQSVAMQSAGHLFSAQLILVGKSEYYFLGRKENIQAAEEMSVYIILQIEHTYKAALPKGLSKSQRSNFRRTFKEAAACRVYKRVDEIIKHQKEYGLPSGETALVVLTAKEQMRIEIEDQLKTQGIKTKIRHFKEGSGTVAGDAAGRRIDIHKGVDQ